MAMAVASLICVQDSARADAMGSLVPPLSLASDPSVFVGKALLMRRVRCVDSIKGGINCVVPAGGRMLAVVGAVLGPLTGADTAQNIIDQCKGSANIYRQNECTFDISFIPKSFQKKISEPNDSNGQIEIVVVNSSEIEIFPPSPTDRFLSVKEIADAVAQSSIFSDECDNMIENRGAIERMFILNGAKVDENYMREVRSARGRADKAVTRMSAIVRCEKAAQMYGPKGTVVPGLLRVD